MHIALLGPVELRDEDGSSIEVTSRRQRQLLAVLALQRGGTVSVDRIAELLWGDDAPSEPSPTLRRASAIVCSPSGGGLPESSGNGIQTPAGCDEPVPWRPYPTMVIVVPTVGKPGCPGCNVSSLTGATLVTFTGWASEMTAMSFWTEGDGPRDEVRVPDETGGADTRAGDGRERYGNALIWSEAMGRRQDGARID